MTTTDINGSYYIWANSMDEKGLYGRNLFQRLHRNGIRNLPAGTMLICSPNPTTCFGFQSEEEILCDKIKNLTIIYSLPGSTHWFSMASFGDDRKIIFANDVRLPTEEEALEYEKANQL